MISHRYKFIFVDIPKTGSESIRRALLPFCSHDVLLEGGETDPKFGYSFSHKKCVNPRCQDSECWQLNLSDWQHKTVYDHVEKYGIDIVKDYFVFSIIRNPFEKIASSILLEAKEKGGDIQARIANESFRKDIALRGWDSNVEWMYGNLDWIRYPRFSGAHRTPFKEIVASQERDDWKITASQLDLSLINLISYYEKDLSSTFDFIKKRTGLPSGITLGNYHKTNNTHYSELFSEELRHSILEIPMMKLERKIFNWELNEA